MLHCLYTKRQFLNTQTKNRKNNSFAVIAMLPKDEGH